VRRCDGCFRGVWSLFGVIVIAISLAHFAVGPDAIIGGSPANPTSDGEDRFFAGLLLCYGLALLWCAREVERKRVYVNLLAAVFFVGGIARLLAVGVPHPFYLAMAGGGTGAAPVMVLLASRVAEPTPGQPR
jgi:hypothetical protein